jgi:hypothetical protein
VRQPGGGRARSTSACAQPALAEDWAAWSRAWQALDDGPLADAGRRRRGAPVHADAVRRARRAHAGRPARRGWRSAGRRGCAARHVHALLEACEREPPAHRAARRAAARGFALEQAGVHPLLARLLAARGVRSADELDDGLASCCRPTTLKGAAEAGALLADAIAARRRICVVADYDCDGATACAVALRGLAMLGAAPARWATWCPTARCTATA